MDARPCPLSNVFFWIANLESKSLFPCFIIASTSKLIYQVCCSRTDMLADLVVLFIPAQISNPQIMLNIICSLLPQCLNDLFNSHFCQPSSIRPTLEFSQ